MPKLKFDDGWEVETGGEYRIVSGPDGLYVTGHGILDACDSYEHGQEIIATLQGHDKRDEKRKGGAQ